jgi:hypothetical protein
MEATAATGDIETGFKSRQFPQAGDFRNSPARNRISGKIDVLAGLRNFLNHYRDMPWNGRIWNGGIWRFMLRHRNGLRVGKNDGAAQ